MDNDENDFSELEKVPVSVSVVTEPETDKDLMVISGVRTFNTIEVNNPEPDPFGAEPEEVRKYVGINDTGFKRKITNQIQKAYTGQGNAKSARIDETLAYSGYDIFGVITPPYNLYAFAKLYELSAPHYAAVNAKVSNIVGLGYNFTLSKKSQRLLQKEQENANQNQIKAEHEHAVATHEANVNPSPDAQPPAPPEPVNHTKKLDKIRAQLDQHQDELYDLMESMNDEDGFVETLVKVWIDYEVTGNGYIEIGRKADGQIGYIGHVPATTVRVRKDRDGFVQVVNGRAQFFANFGDQKTRSPFNSENKCNEMMHIKKYSPSNTFYGVPDIIAAQQAIAGKEYAAQYNLDYFHNKAVPRHVITLTGAKLGPQAEADLLAFFETGIKGPKGNHRSIFIPLPPAGPDGKPPTLEFKPVEAGQQESSFKNFNEENTNEILMAHRVFKTKVSVSSGASVAIAADADKTFKEQVCAPQQQMFEVKLNKIVKELTDAYVLELNEMTLTDENTTSQINERYAKVGVKTRNEIRTTLGLGNVDGGDEIIDMNGAKGASGPTSQVAPPNPAKTQAMTEATTQRTRDANRSANQSDGQATGRNPKGAGRKQP